MVEQKFSLELTKNGIQQMVYAKEGEALARKIIITLTNKGEVVSLTGYNLKVYFDDQTYWDESAEEFNTKLLKNNGVSASFILPQNLCAAPGERLCELQLVKGEEKVYSAQFRVTVEDTFGATASAGAIGTGLQYEPLFAGAQAYSETYDGSGVIPYYDSTVGETRKLSPSSITAEVEGDIDDLEEDIGDINTALEGKADTTTVNAALALKADASDVTSALALKADASTVNTALAGKVDIVSGKGLSTNDYDATEKGNVASNTSARHTHSNKTVLDKFGESSGAPTYDGNPIGGGGTITDVQDTDGNSLVDDGVATIPTGKMLEIVASSSQGVITSKYTRSEVYDFFIGGVALSCQGVPILSVVRGDNYYLYFFNGGFNDTPYFTRREIKSDKTIGAVSSVLGYYIEGAEKTKLGYIENNAQVNKIETIKLSDGTVLTITNKAVTLPAIPAAQIQSDWEQSDNTAKDYIKNKPSIPAAQVQADWNESDNTKADFIKNKPTIPDVSGKEDTSNKLKSVSGGGAGITSSATDTQYPSAKAVYDALPNIPDGTNSGDILVWDGDEWVSKPKWQMTYQPVEYIESTGTQWINTGVTITSDLRVVTREAITNTSMDNRNGVVNNNSGVNKSFSWGAFPYSTYTDFMSLFGSSSGTWAHTGVTLDTNPHDWDIQNGSQKIDNTEYANQGILDIPNNISLMAWTQANGSVITYTKMRHYYSKIYKNGTLIRDFVPCYRISDGVIGLYDAVNHNFYTNAGSGTFTKGADVN